MIVDFFALQKNNNHNKNKIDEQVIYANDDHQKPE